MRRMFFKKNKREKKEEMELDITSLLDVLVILLVFLLKSYNASDLKLNLVKDLVIPDSQARKLGHHAVTIQVSKDATIFINNKKIGATATKGENPILLEKLKEFKANEMDRTPAESKISKKEVKNINLVFDENLPYQVMKSVMHTSAMAGYTEFKFIVQGNY